MKKYLPSILLTLLTGCVSLTAVETQYKQNNKLVDSEVNKNTHIEIKYVNMGAEICISSDQKVFLNTLVKKYFLTENSKRATIVTRQIFSNNIVVGALNASVTILTFSLVPMYYDTAFEFLITVEETKSSRNYYAFVNDRGLISVLAVPFMFTHSQNSVRRNNFENAFFLSANKGTSNNEVLSKLQTYIPGVCSSVVETRLKF